MHKATVEVYEKRGALWAAKRKPVRQAHAVGFASRVEQGALRVDLGCGAGRYISDLGSPVVGMDAARSMLEHCRAGAPHVALVQGDLEALPFARGTLGGGWANMSYQHVPGVRVPLALADLHGALRLGTPLDLQVLGGDYEGDALAEDEVGGRFFCGWGPERLQDLMVGAGFEVENTEVDDEVVRVSASRARTLPDFVGPHMRLLLVGLNPSLFAADVGVGYARGSNRFWPAALEAGLVSRDRDPVHALLSHGIGMTDLVKRATSNAADLRPTEYRDGIARIEGLVEWLKPSAICMIGLTGWRAAIDPRAQAGMQQTRLAGSPVYVMPSTSGANAHVTREQLAVHLRAAAALSEAEGRGQGSRSPA